MDDESVGIRVSIRSNAHILKPTKTGYLINKRAGAHACLGIRNIIAVHFK